jgi:hypothetical protein
MTFYEQAAEVFILATFLKFLIGALNFSYEMDATAELAACVLLAFIGGVSRDMTGGSIVLAASLAFFAMTLWAALQLWRMKQLFALTKGTGR